MGAWEMLRNCNIAECTSVGVGGGDKIRWCVGSKQLSLKIQQSALAHVDRLAPLRRPRWLSLILRIDLRFNDLKTREGLVELEHITAFMVDSYKEKPQKDYWLVDHTPTLRRQISCEWSF